MHSVNDEPANIHFAPQPPQPPNPTTPNPLTVADELTKVQGLLNTLQHLFAIYQRIAKLDWSTVSLHFLAPFLSSEVMTEISDMHIKRSIIFKLAR